ncbi:MAG TPA: acyl-CoA dehydrogenase family protein [Acetobacteraceae bacterium]|nr:acyl-CoA dehydrogenase family protein [Acetobacteraceae bacterium]
MSYAAIAREKAAIVERTGLLGEGSMSARLVTRFFIEGFATAEQRQRWQSQITAVAISEPKVGAHPKLLTTRADEGANGFSISGEKAWVTNGPLAAVFIVLAITAEDAGRKRYSAFLVPRDTPGLSIEETPQYQVLAPSRHCGLRLNCCRVPRSAVLGLDGTAYEALAMPFRGVEDAVGSFGLLGMFRFLLRRLAASQESEEAALSLGGLAALAALFAEGAAVIVAALDVSELEARANVLAGLYVLARDMLARARAHRDAFGPACDEAIDRAFADLDTALSVARGPRTVRQARLGRMLFAAAARKG